MPRPLSRTRANRFFRHFVGRVPAIPNEVERGFKGAVRRASLAFVTGILSLATTDVWASATIAHTPSRPTYGAEFEFTNEKVASGPLTFGLKGHEYEGAIAFARVVHQKCLAYGCEVIKHKSKWEQHEFRVTFQNGFWFHISYDPSVVEINTRPATLEQLRELKPLLDEMIFASARDAGLFVDPKNKAGHFNYGARSTFGDSSLSLLRHFVDFQNRPELALGILRRNLRNAAPLAVLDQSQREALAALARDESFGKLKLAAAAEVLQHKVYTRSYLADRDPFHDQALVVRKVAAMKGNQPDQPIEIRAIRSQRDMNDFLLLAELHEARLAYLERLGKNWLYTGTSRTEFSERELVSRFFIYVAETGRPWARYRRLLPDELRAIELDPFVTGNHDWTSREFVAAVRSHLELIADSPWMRAHLADAFDRVTDAGVANARTILAEIAETAAQAPFTQEARMALDGFHAEAIARHPRLAPTLEVRARVGRLVSSELCRAAFARP